MAGSLQILDTPTKNITATIKAEDGTIVSIVSIIMCWFSLLSLLLQSLLLLLLVEFLVLVCL